MGSFHVWGDDEMVSSLLKEFVEKAPAELENVIDTLNYIQRQVPNNEFDFKQPIQILTLLHKKLLTCQNETLEKPSTTAQDNKLFIINSKEKEVPVQQYNEDITELTQRISDLENRFKNLELELRNLENKKAGDYGSITLITSAVPDPVATEVPKEQGSFIINVNDNNLSSMPSKEVLQSVVPSKPMNPVLKNFINEYNTQSFRTRKLKLIDSLALKLLHGTSEILHQDDQSEKIILEETAGEGPYYYKAVADEINRYYIVPIKAANFTAERIIKDGYKEVFDFNVENFSPFGCKKFNLVMPAIFEKSASGQYELLEKGKIEIIY